MNENEDPGCEVVVSGAHDHHPRLEFVRGAVGPIRFIPDCLICLTPLLHRGPPRPLQRTRRDQSRHERRTRRQHRPAGAVRAGMAFGQRRRWLCRVRPGDESVLDSETSDFSARSRKARICAEAYSCTPHKEIRCLTPRLQKSAVSGRELARCGASAIPVLPGHRGNPGLGEPRGFSRSSPRELQRAGPSSAGRGSGVPPGPAMPRSPDGC